MILRDTLCNIWNIAFCAGRKGEGRSRGESKAILSLKTRKNLENNMHYFTVNFIAHMYKYNEQYCAYSYRLYSTQLS